MADELPTYSETLAGVKRDYAIRLQAIRADIAADVRVRESMSRDTRRRLLQELGTCAASLVLRGNPWHNKTGD